MGFDLDNAKKAVRLFYHLEAAREGAEAVGDGRTVECVCISRSESFDDVNIPRGHPLFHEMLDLLIRANKSRVQHIEDELRAIGAEVPE